MVGGSLFIVTISEEVMAGVSILLVLFLFQPVCCGPAILHSLHSSIILPFFVVYFFGVPFRVRIPEPFRTGLWCFDSGEKACLSDLRRFRAMCTISLWALA